MRPLQLQQCCSPIASASTAAPRSCPLLVCASVVALRLSPFAAPAGSSPCPARSRSFEVRRLHRRSRVTSVVLPPEHPTSVAHINTDPAQTSFVPRPRPAFRSTEKRGEPGMFPHVSITVIDKRPKFSERKSEVTDYTFNAWCVCDSRPPLAR